MEICCSSQIFFITVSTIFHCSIVHVGTLFHCDQTNTKISLLVFPKIEELHSHFMSIFLNKYLSYNNKHRIGKLLSQLIKQNIIFLENTKIRSEYSACPFLECKKSFIQHLGFIQTCVTSLMIVPYTCQLLHSKCKKRKSILSKKAVNICN